LEQQIVSLHLDVVRCIGRRGGDVGDSGLEDALHLLPLLQPLLMLESSIPSSSETRELMCLAAFRGGVDWAKGAAQRRSLQLSDNEGFIKREGFISLLVALCCVNCVFRLASADRSSVREAFLCTYCDGPVFTCFVSGSQQAESHAALGHWEGYHSVRRLLSPSVICLFSMSVALSPGKFRRLPLHNQR